jgi:hypothetical protein
MELNPKHLTAALAVGGVLFLPCAIFAQGSLTPPGPPAPTMKTLEQIEPRIDLAKVSGNALVRHIITAPGSYYLSSNIDYATTDTGIEIRASGVTLDLMGFRITRSGATAGPAIRLASGATSDITIKNGHISGPNISDGITENITPDPVNVRVTGVTVSNVSANGIYLGADISNSVDRCSVRTTGGAGITAGEISYSIALSCGGTGLQAYGSVSHSRGESTGGDGIDAARIVTHSVGLTTSTSNSADGIAGDLVSNSTGISAGDDGIDSATNVSHSSGFTIGTGDGIEAEQNVSNSYGEAGANGDDGIDAVHTISYSRGFANGSDNGLECTIAIGCTSGGGESITHKYLMP